MPLVQLTFTNPVSAIVFPETDIHLTAVTDTESEETNAWPADGLLSTVKPDAATAESVWNEAVSAGKPLSVVSQLESAMTVAPFVAAVAAGLV